MSRMINQEFHAESPCHTLRPDSPEPLTLGKHACLPIGIVASFPELSYRPQQLPRA